MRRIEDWPEIGIVGFVIEGNKVSPKLKYFRYGKYCLGGLDPLAKNIMYMLKERQLYFEELL